MTEEDVVTVNNNDIDLAAPCKGHTIMHGKNEGKLSKHKRYARESLIKAKGPPPFSGAVCRHLCENDSYIFSRPDGFVCINPQHLTWGTQQENVLDQDLEVRAECMRKVNASMTHEQKSERNRKGAASPNHISKQIGTCPHCGKIGKGRIMMRWHFDRCSLRSLPDGT